MDNFSEHNNKKSNNEQDASSKYNIIDNIQESDQNETSLNNYDSLNTTLENEESSIDEIKTLNYLLCKQINQKNNIIRNLEKNIKLNARKTNESKIETLQDNEEAYISQLKDSITASEKHIKILRTVIKGNQSNN